MELLLLFLSLLFVLSHRQARLDTIKRNTHAFDEAAVTCKCKRSECLKNYCDCFNSNRRCTSACACFNCKNGNAPSLSSDRAYPEKIHPIPLPSSASEHNSPAPSGPRPLASVGSASRVARPSHLPTGSTASPAQVGAPQLPDRLSSPQTARGLYHLGNSALAAAARRYS
jgi:hypothetical protein